jgi:DNA-directed RNA polymerase specialized sigma24 family protein
VNSLSAHLTAGRDHGRLRFHPDCPVCRNQRLAGTLSDPVLSTRRRLLESRRRGESIRNLEHALRWQIHNCWLEERRRQRRRRTVPVDQCEDGDLSSHSAGDPAEAVMQLEAARELLRAARAIDPLSWSTVLLGDVWGIPAGEVAKTLGIPGRTYRRRHAGALAAISSRVAGAPLHRRRGSQGDFAAHVRAAAIAR